MQKKKESMEVLASIVEAIQEYFEVCSFETKQEILQSSEIMEGAAECGHLNMVQWLHEQGCASSAQAMDLAAENNHLQVVQWLHINRTEGCTGSALITSAQNWLLSHRPECQDKSVIQYACWNAIQKGVNDVLDCFAGI